MSIESVITSNHLILCRPLLLPSIFLIIRVFPIESNLLIRWPEFLSFSFNISPSNEYSGLISFRMDWLDLLAVQGTLKSLLQYYSSKASILWCSAFFIVQLSHPYMQWSAVKVPQSCPTLCNPTDYKVHVILQARILEWVAFLFSRGSSQPRDQTQLSRIAGEFFTSWATSLPPLLFSPAVPLTLNKFQH